MGFPQPHQSNSTANEASARLSKCFPCTAGVRTIAPSSAQRGPYRPVWSYEPSITESSKFQIGNADWQRKVPGRSGAGHVADSYDISMRLLFLWDFSGISMIFLLDVYDISMVLLLNFYEIPMACLWDFHDVSMVFL
jgi:hypothetical protein